MTTQPRLWGHADTATRQPGLFDGSAAVDVPCPRCGRLQVVTASGYLTCPAGCLKLQPDGPTATVDGPTLF